MVFCKAKRKVEDEVILRALNELEELYEGVISTRPVYVVYYFNDEKAEGYILGYFTNETEARGIAKQLNNVYYLEVI